MDKRLVRVGEGFVWGLIMAMIACTPEANASPSEKLVSPPEKLVSPQEKPVSPLSERQLALVYCSARNMYYEARGEGIQGMLAVMWVVQNRIDNPAFPNDACTVIIEHGQFPWTNLEKEYMPLDESKTYLVSLHIAASFVRGEQDPDPTKGSLYYHNNVVSPCWITGVKPTVVIGNHLFYKEVSKGTECLEEK